MLLIPSITFYSATTKEKIYLYRRTKGKELYKDLRRVLNTREARKIMKKYRRKEL